MKQGEEGLTGRGRINTEDAERKTQRGRGEGKGKEEKNREESRYDDLRLDFSLAGRGWVRIAVGQLLFAHQPRDCDPPNILPFHSNVFPSSSVFSVPSVVTPLPHLSRDHALSLTRVQRMLLVPAGDDVAEQVEDLILGQRIEQALWHD